MSSFNSITIDEMDNIQFIIEEIEEITISEFEKIKLSHADIYYKFRYTFNEEMHANLNDQKSITDEILKILRPYMSSEYYTAGIEWFKSGMVDCKHHVHVHFISRTKKDTIVKKLKRSSDSWFSGNRCYSLGVEVNVDKDKFFRYPLKQQQGDTRKYIKAGGFSKESLIQMRDCAYAVWLTAAEVMNKKIQKKEDSDQLCDRLFVYLDNIGQMDTDLKIKVSIQKFYIEQEKKPFNKTTALGYFYNYKIQKGLMTHEELAALW